jgi:16S rRNA (uracil1498-N3)-methyltransferase
MLFLILSFTHANWQLQSSSVFFGLEQVYNMRIHRFYCERITEPTTVITGDEVRHIRSVMRLNPGDSVELFDGRGTLAQAVIDDISKKQVTLTVNKLEIHDRSETPKIIIAAAIAKGDRFDDLIAKCTELGVDGIVPIIFGRTVKHPKNPKTLSRWNNIAIASAKQCKRLFLPTIDSPAPLEQAVTNLKNQYQNAQILLGSLDNDCKKLTSVAPGEKDVIAIVGPEGGFADSEKNLLKSAAAQPVRLTDTVLRVETAAIAFASILATRRYESDIF